jgi:hypothetical protein
MRPIVVLIVLFAAAGCTGPVSPERRAAALSDVPLDRAHPPGRISSFPPADSSFSPLRCWMDGPNTFCSR